MIGSHFLELQNGNQDGEIGFLKMDNLKIQNQIENLNEAGILTINNGEPIDIAVMDTPIPIYPSVIWTSIRNDQLDCFQCHYLSEFSMNYKRACIILTNSHQLFKFNYYFKLQWAVDNPPQVHLKFEQWIKLIFFPCGLFLNFWKFRFFIIIYIYVIYSRLSYLKKNF